MREVSEPSSLRARVVSMLREFPRRTRLHAWRRRAAAVSALWAVVLVVVAISIGAGTAEAGADPALPVLEVRASEAAQMPSPALDAYLGVVPAEAARGVSVSRVMPGSPAEAAGLQAGDMVTSVGGTPVIGIAGFDHALARFRPGNRVDVAYTRGGRPARTFATLSSRRPRDGVFRSNRFRLAVVPLRFAGETKPVDVERLRDAMFSAGGTGPGASLADYYRDQSYGFLDVSGDVLAPVELTEARSVYAGKTMGGVDGSAYVEAASAIAARMTASELAAYDGISFIYRGPAESRPGFSLWPHRATVQIHGRRIAYYVLAADGGEGFQIGVHCHEFGHLLGLPDTYGAGHRTGHGDFCLMALGHRGGGRTGAASPFSLCVQCRSTLGWVTPRVVDPRTTQRIRLRPIGADRTQSLIVPVSETTREHLLLEVRSRRGFDAELPSEGLLVWRVGGRGTPGQGVYTLPVDLVEAHGIDVFDASLVRTGEIAFPTPRARDVTPETTPSSGPARDPMTPWITDIVREDDGSVVLTIGVRRAVRQRPPQPSREELPPAGATVVRMDPVTGEAVTFPGGGSTLDAPGGTGAGRR